MQGTPRGCSPLSYEPPPPSTRCSYSELPGRKTSSSAMRARIRQRYRWAELGIGWALSGPRCWRKCSVASHRSRHLRDGGVIGALGIAGKWHERR